MRFDGEIRPLLRLAPWILLYLGLFFAVNGALIARVSDVVASYADPFASTPSGETRYASLLGPLIGHALGISTEAGAILFNGFLVLLAVVALAWLLIRLLGREQRLPFALALLALTPLLEVLLSWLGKPDPLLIISYALFAGTRSPLIRNSGVFLMLLAHKEEALVMLALHFLLFAPERRAWRSYVPGILGGLLILSWYAQLLGNPPGRVAFVFDNLEEISQNLQAIPIIILASLDWFWLALIPLLRDRAERTRILFALALIVAVTLLTIDTTRVAAVISVPLVLYVILYLKDTPLPRYALPALLFLSLFQIEWAGGLLTLTHWHQWPWEQMQYWAERYLSSSPYQT